MVRPNKLEGLYLENPFQSGLRICGQTQLEDLSDASFLGKLLVLPTNVRLDWKEIARYKHSNLFGLVISNREKRFITLTPGANVIKLFTSVSYENFRSKLKCLPLASLTSLV